MGALIGGGAMTDCNCDTVAAADVVVVVVDAVVDDAGGAGASEIGCIGFLFGVEHTIVLFSVDDELIEWFVVTAAATAVNVDEVVVETFRSDLLARTAVGLTGCENKNGLVTL